MSHIQLSRSHALGVNKARTAVNKVAKAIADDFDVEYEWDGNTLDFQRPGVHGQIQVDSNSVHVEVHLSFLLFAIKNRVREEIESQLDLHFGSDS